MKTCACRFSTIKTKGMRLTKIYTKSGEGEGEYTPLN